MLLYTIYGLLTHANNEDFHVKKANCLLLRGLYIKIYLFQQIIYSTIRFMVKLVPEVSKSKFKLILLLRTEWCCSSLIK